MFAETPTSNPEATPIERLTFEEALAQLETIVTTLERGDVPLNQALSYYERGEQLKRHCENLLKSVERKIEQIKRDNENGAPKTEAFDIED